MIGVARASPHFSPALVGSPVRYAGGRDAARLPPRAVDRAVEERVDVLAAQGPAQEDAAVVDAGDGHVPELVAVQEMSKDTLSMEFTRTRARLASLGRLFGSGSLSRSSDSAMIMPPARGNHTQPYVSIQLRVPKCRRMGTRWTTRSTTTGAVLLARISSHTRPWMRDPTQTTCWPRMGAHMSERLPQLFRAIMRASRAGRLTEAGGEEALLERFGTECAMLVLDSTGIAQPLGKAPSTASSQKFRRASRTLSCRLSESSPRHTSGPSQRGSRPCRPQASPCCGPDQGPEPG